MMRCEDARSGLLEAEPAELRGEDGSELARHIQDCHSCALVARRILEGQEALAEALARASQGVGRFADPAEARGQVERRRWMRRRAVWAVAAPLAAAALGGVAFFQSSRQADPGNPMGTVPGWALPLTGSSESGSVVRTGGERVAVLPTGNPDITVVWFIK